jgi:hypothetical protein
LSSRLIGVLRNQYSFFVNAMIVKRSANNLDKA